MNFKNQIYKQCVPYLNSKKYANSYSSCNLSYPYLNVNVLQDRRLPEGCLPVIHLGTFGLEKEYDVKIQLTISSLCDTSGSVGNGVGNASTKNKNTTNAKLTLNARLLITKDYALIDQFDFPQEYFKVIIPLVITGQVNLDQK